MKYSLKILLNIGTVFIISILIIVLPTIYFKIQEKQLLNIKNEISIDVVTIEKTKSGLLDMYKRLEMIHSQNNAIESITLKTGDKYSLYEARKQCYKELCKIPVLEMDIYGPAQRDINIIPKLIIDSVTPAYSIIIWSGTLEINEINYNIILDEESGKLLYIQREYPSQWESAILDEKLKEQWEKYFYY